MMAVIVEGRQLVETVIASIVAGVGATVVFSVAIWGAARFADLSRNERPLAAGGAIAVAGLALLLTVAGVVLGIVVMTKKYPPRARSGAARSAAAPFRDGQGTRYGLPSLPRPPCPGAASADECDGRALPLPPWAGRSRAALAAASALPGAASADECDGRALPRPPARARD